MNWILNDEGNLTISWEKSERTPEKLGYLNEAPNPEPARPARQTQSLPHWSNPREALALLTH